MLTKLATRNVKRQLSSYLIYFITVVITVALIFAINNFVYSDDMAAKLAKMSQLKGAMNGLTIMVSAIIAFVLGYATAFILKLRKKEFGTYLILGMTRKDILTIFFIETLLMFVVALVVGIILGLFLFQGLMSLISTLMEVPIVLAEYSFKGLALTVGIIALIFFLSSFISMIYLKKVNIIDLIHGDKKTDAEVKHPFIWLGVAIISLAVVIVAIVLLALLLVKGLKGEDISGSIMLYISLISVFVVVMHIGAAKGIVALLLRNKKLSAKGTNTFTLRQINGKLKANSIMMGFLAFLISVAIIGSNLSFIQKAVVEESLNLNYPFDISVNIDVDEEHGFEFDEAEQIINRYTQIEKKEEFLIYQTDNNFLHSHTRYSGENYNGVKDSFIPLSAYNRLLVLLGQDKITLNDEYLLIDNYGNIGVDFSKVKLPLNNKEYTLKTIKSDARFFLDKYLVAIVPDDALAGLKVSGSGRAYGLAKGDFDSKGLENALTYTRDLGIYTERNCDYKIKEEGRTYFYSQAAIFIVGAIYISIVFVFLAMALLALKTLSELKDDRQKYSILYRLGADKRTLKKTLFTQIFSFFILPFIVPLLFSIPTAIISYQLMSTLGFAVMGASISIISVSIAAFITAIYLLYFTATYFIAKKNVICS